ncbi:hypothetical protein QRX50_20240 [Amycolatopsis carbonis]|uniref:Uncharacterized protein n=1 Tax=Amycolatopsis carbonis TaxID=715471 RepID=A0A9Y2IMN1_9PSEU|nr:hypothetical protein [Amycolatopsis sp. 2-15]WIX82927.1 hypothetical protein QRX50_20240 [Amycolatopsis sp. 2-15]
MALGSTYRRCSCRDEAGRELGAACPKLKNSRHGQWAFRIELPPDENGTRRPRRRAGFESATKAQDQLDQVRDLLAIPEEDDDETRRKIGDLIAEAIARKAKLPDVEETRRLVKVGADVADDPLMAEVLVAFLAAK